MLLSAAASEFVRITRIGAPSGFTAYGRYTSARGSISRPKCRTSPTTPITVIHGARSGVELSFSRLPTALSPGQYLRAMVSLISSTAPGLASSCSSK